MRALAPSWYARVIAPSDNDSSAARLAADTSGGSPERLKRELAALFEELARMQPVVLCFDDMHWADPSTTDLLGYLARRIDNARLLIIATCRPSDLAQARHPFLAMKLDLLARGMCRELAPGSLDLGAVARYIALQFPEHTFPSDFARVVHGRSEGNPLFMTELLRDLRRRQRVRLQDGRWTLAERLDAVERELPETVRNAVQRKIEALEDADRRLLGAAAVQGVDFDSGMVANALQLPEADVEDRLERLEREHALVRFVEEFEAPDRSLTLRYRFAHQLYHAAFYDALRGTRRAALSRAIAERTIQRAGEEATELGGAARGAARGGPRQPQGGALLEPGGPGGRAPLRARRQRRGWPAAASPCCAASPTRRTGPAPNSTSRSPTPWRSRPAGAMRCRKSAPPTPAPARSAARCRTRPAWSPSSSAWPRITSSRARSPRRGMSPSRCSTCSSGWATRTSR